MRPHPALSGTAPKPTWLPIGLGSLLRLVQTESFRWFRPQPGPQQQVPWRLSSVMAMDLLASTIYTQRSWSGLRTGFCGSPAGADDGGASQISQVFSQQLWRQPWGGAGLAGAELAEGRSQLRRGSEHLTRSRTTRKQPKPQRCISKLWPHWND